MCKGFLSIFKTNVYSEDELPFSIPYTNQIKKEANYSMEMYEYHRRSYTTFVSVQLLEYLLHIGRLFHSDWHIECIMEEKCYSVKHYELFFQKFFLHSHKETLDEIIDSLEGYCDLNPLFISFVFQSSYICNYIKVESGESGENGGLEEDAVEWLIETVLVYIGRNYINTFKNKDGESALYLFGIISRSKRELYDMYRTIGKNIYHLDKRNILLLERMRSCIKK